ncbi:IclR family transcriptional regulator [Comamonas sp. BIGb0124]|uniref:IclR family transcriptional regulator n=1 Tax=Comamonas sp. BIGb0124 TaxID=2485130 RepID=UPI0013158EB6|nr:IclR family transcriptional regulator [Comamonas sp. BIGb0124]
MNTSPAATPWRPGVKTATSPVLIKSFDKGLAILDWVLRAPERPRLQQVADAMGIDKSSASRFLATLLRHEVLVRDPVTRTYGAGERVALWTQGSDASRKMLELARPHLRHLRRVTGHTAHLAVLRDDRVVLVEVKEAEAPASVRQTPGDWEPLYCSAVGKAIVAFLPIVILQRVVTRMGWHARTPRTLTSSEQLHVELRSIRRDRVAFDDRENNPDIGCVASPVLDNSGYPMASIGISMRAPLHPQGIRGQHVCVAAVREAARALSTLLTTTRPTTR